MRRITITILVVTVIVFFGVLLRHNVQVARFGARQAALAEPSGPAGASLVIKEWDVPTPNSRPHDPAVAPDGALWYAGQMSNTLGRLDPATGEIREYRLNTPDSGPHGLVADRDGNIWFTANFKGYIG